MSNKKEDRGISSRSMAGQSAKELPNNSSAKENGQEPNNSQEPRSFKQALINLFPRDFYSLLFGTIAIICLYHAVTTGNIMLLWSVWASVGLLVGIAPRAKQGVQWAKDHYELQVTNGNSFLSVALGKNHYGNYLTDFLWFVIFYLRAAVTTFGVAVSLIYAKEKKPIRS